MMLKATSLVLSVFLLFASSVHAKDVDRMKSAERSKSTSTCTGHYPSYFQDPAFADTGMWDDQVIINRPPSHWRGPVFQLSDAYAGAVPEKNYPWLRFNPFDPKLNADEKTEQAKLYILAVMRYIQEGNINSGKVETDWALCRNKIRKWYHMPYQTYDPLSGREFVHGLTREAPVVMGLNGGKHQLKTTMWAVGFYNPAAARSISTVWTGAAAPVMPTAGFHFDDGSVIGKLLFTTATPNQFPFLANMPVWRANISAPEFCKCIPSSGTACTYKEETEQCPRVVGDVYLLQFDIAVSDKRSPIGWVYGTFVADGQRKGHESNPWNRISPLGLMWGNDAPPIGEGAAAFPADPRRNGFHDGVIFWDTVDMLNLNTDAGHLGCNSRLNGPADNAQSSCLSCHQTASVPDSKNDTPAILYQFSKFRIDRNGQCESKPDKLDLDIDQVYFKTFNCSTSFTGPAKIVPPPSYGTGPAEWISTDFSLQLSISLVQWQEWQQDRQQRPGARIFNGILPSR